MSVHHRGFPKAVLYQELAARSPPDRVRERGPDGGAPPTERHLQCVWYDPFWRPPALRTIRGEPVEIESPGRWNLEAGPDFLDAALRVGLERRRLQGDVEVHVHAADWERHGHADDPRYRRVVAHVCYDARELPAGQLPPAAVQISLREALRSLPNFSFAAVDVTAYPHASFPRVSPPCAEVLAAWPLDEQRSFLEAAGQERLRRKAEQWAVRMDECGEEQAFYEGILAALGYQHNRTACAQLAQRVPLQALREEAEGRRERGYALLLGVAGLLPPTIPRGADAEARAFLRTLWDHWWKLQARWQEMKMPRNVWRLAGLRPANHPARRLAAAAALALADPPLTSRVMPSCDAVSDRWPSEAMKIIETTASFPFWSRRLSLTGARQNRPVSLLGAGRAAAMVTNVLVPFLAARGVDMSGCLSALPVEEDHALARHTAHTLFGRDHNPRLTRSGLRQQGLLQVFLDFCLVDRSGCRECALAGALRTSDGVMSRDLPPPE